MRGMVMSGVVTVAFLGQPGNAFNGKKNTFYKTTF
jgi:hypothetical protein